MGRQDSFPAIKDHDCSVNEIQTSNYERKRVTVTEQLPRRPLTELLTIVRRLIILQEAGDVASKEMLRLRRFWRDRVTRKFSFSV